MEIWRFAFSGEVLVVPRNHDPPNGGTAEHEGPSQVGFEVGELAGRHPVGDPRALESRMSSLRAAIVGSSSSRNGARRMANRKVARSGWSTTQSM